MIKIDCSKCVEQKSCCSFGAWVDLEEAKKIVPLKLKGIFHHFEEDDDFPSGFKVGTSREDEPCTFLTPKGLCSIHKVDYDLKPTHCKEFPYDGGKLAPNVDLLCPAVKSIKKAKSLPVKSQKTNSPGRKR